MEGFRGEPRTKTFFPVEKGFKYKPTVVNNVETFCAAARIIEMGGPAYREMGTALSSGSKLFSVSGDCDKPGVYEIMWGTSIRKLLELCGARDTKFIQWSGPSGTLLSEQDFDLQINNEDMLCGGAVTIFNSTRNIVDVVRNYNTFFINESCGLCTPCRAGNYLIGKKLKRLKKGKGANSDLEDLKKWSEIIKKTSRCGLGKTSCNTVLDMLDKFNEEVNELIHDNGLELEHEFDVNDYTHDYSDFALKMNSNG
jgi:[NiFe] hydrogenase diaphorase moiety large subunit